MVSARSSLSTIVFGLPKLLFVVLALSTTILPVADAFYIPQEFNIDAARNETDRQVVPSSCRGPRATARTHLQQFDDMGTVNVFWGGIDTRSAALVRRDVWSPGILSPDTSDVWQAGSVVQVRWDASSPPAQVTNYMGRILLGHEQDPDGNEHLDFEHPLAQGFNLSQGAVDVIVPDVVPSNDYFVVLYGDSGNRSPSFTILERPLIIV